MWLLCVSTVAALMMLAFLTMLSLMCFSVVSWVLGFGLGLADDSESIFLELSDLIFSEFTSLWWGLATFVVVLLYSLLFVFSVFGTILFLFSFLTLLRSGISSGGSLSSWLSWSSLVSGLLGCWSGLRLVNWCYFLFNLHFLLGWLRLDLRNRLRLDFNWWFDFSLYFDFYWLDLRLLSDSFNHFLWLGLSYVSISHWLKMCLDVFLQLCIVSKIIECFCESGHTFIQSTLISSTNRIPKLP